MYMRFKSLTLISIWPFTLLKRFGIRQFIKFGIVGGMNTAIDYSIYYFLTRSFDYFQEHFLIANLMSFIIAVTNSFLWNKYWTFRDKGKKYHIQFPKFFMVNIIALTISQITLYLLVKELGMNDLISKAVAIVIALFWNFFMNKYWVFKKKAVINSDGVPKETTNELT